MKREQSSGRYLSSTYAAAAVLTMLLSTFLQLDAIRGWRPCGGMDVGAILGESAVATALTLVSCFLWLWVTRRADKSYENVRGATSVALVVAAFLGGSAFFLGVVLLSPGISGEYDTCGFDLGTAVVRAVPVLVPLIALAIAVTATPRRRRVTLRGAAWFGAIVLGAWVGFGTAVLVTV